MSVFTGPVHTGFAGFLSKIMNRNGANYSVSCAAAISDLVPFAMGISFFGSPLRRVFSKIYNYIKNRKFVFEAVAIQLVASKSTAVICRGDRAEISFLKRYNGGAASNS